MDWNIDEIKNTDCSVISDALINGGKEEQIDVSENSLNLHPSINDLGLNRKYSSSFSGLEDISQ
jgi:hypothetical protein